MRTADFPSASRFTRLHLDECQQQLSRQRTAVPPRRPASCAPRRPRPPRAAVCLRLVVSGCYLHEESVLFILGVDHGPKEPPDSWCYSVVLFIPLSHFGSLFSHSPIEGRLGQCPALPLCMKLPRASAQRFLCEPAFPLLWQKCPRVPLLSPMVSVGFM